MIAAHRSVTSLPRRRLLQAGAACLLAPPLSRAAHAAPPAPFGRVERWENFSSHHVDPRHVDIWLPPDYATKAGAGHRFAVVYMHDGQMLFDPTTTWNGKSWRIDLAAQQLLAARPDGDFIVVGPWNNGVLRHSEYFPAKFLPHLPDAVRRPFVRDALHGKARSDDYLRFLVEELKPAIDARFATRTGRDTTFLMGSSMGGLISCYGLCEYPAVFGGAACLSTHWIGTFERNDAFPAAALAYLERAAPAPAGVKLWSDRGTVGLDALYDDAFARVTALLRRKGYAAPDFVSRVYDGAAHDENDWAVRAPDALVFLLRGT
ncbi:alpha/beta hydrolase [Massilia sp. TW-1]|uniref:Alpha/beta hydrolase n=1 Tax=Telluria antibiotica TaxID=2717319 RepID=A0ABX0P963_9BURK|nr:alpha/beta hydrolase-fold protein [Telluria antibiotica]NIA53826.1 alpha/beta hydrolase [Telluria antibiotica]